MPQNASDAATGDDEHGRGTGGRGKKQKRLHNLATPSDHATLFEKVVFSRTEEEILAAAAEWHTILNGSGASRQVVLSLSAQRMRETIPALHAAMGEDS